MKRAIFTALMGLSSAANAGGLDLSGQSIGFIFNEGTVAELGFGIVSPRLSGNDSALFGGGASGNIGSNTTVPMLSFKHDFTDRLSFGIIYEKPFGSEVTYDATSLAFGGTNASATSQSVTGVLRFKLTDRISVHGGARWQTADADFNLSGGIYGPFSGYSARMNKDSGFGYVVGAAFEIPEYFIRASLTYNSAIRHTFDTVETTALGSVQSQVDTETPQSINLEFTSGIAPGTFVFGGVRWVEWSALQFAPPVLSAASPDPLVDFNDTTTISLGIGHQFNENWTALASVIYEPGTNPRTTPLTPVDGFYGGSLGVVYTRGNTQLHANVTATFLNDTTPFVGALGTTVSSFSDNTSVAAGLKLVQKF